MNHRDTIFNAWNCAWGAGDLGPFEQLLAPDYICHSRSGILNLDGLRKTIEAIHAAFPDFTTDVLHVIEDRATAAVHWRGTGTHTGTFMDILPTGRTITVAGASFLRFNGETISEEWVVCEPGELLSGLGLWHLVPESQHPYSPPLLGSGGPRSPTRRRPP